MKPSIVAATAALAASPIGAAAQDTGPVTEILRKEDRTTIEGSPDTFTGKVTITAPFQRPAPSRVGGALVRFEPGARTAWHRHPLGQTLIVTEGVGWTQIEGGPRLEFREGDIMWCPADHKHWHGATPHGPMAHFAIQESQDGSPVTWLEHVADEDYLAAPAAD